MVIWNLGSLALHGGSPLLTPLVWVKIMSIGAQAMPVLFFLFTQYYLEKTPGRLLLAMCLGTYMVLVVGTWLGAFVDAVDVAPDGGIAIDFTPVAIIAFLHWFVFNGWSAVRLAYTYRRTRASHRRNQLRYPLLAISIVFLGLIANFTPLSPYPADIAATLVSALLITYALIRHELLDLSMVGRKALASTALIGVLAATYLVPLLILDLLRRLRVWESMLLSALVASATALVLAVTVRPFYDWLKDRIDQLFFRQRYARLRVLRALPDELASSLDLDTVAAVLLRRIAEVWPVRTIGLFAREEYGHSFVIVASWGLDQPGAPGRLWLGQSLVEVLQVRDAVIARDDLETGVLDHLQEDQQPSWEAPSWGELFVPIRHGGDLTGVLVVGSRQREHDFSLDERHLLATLASRTAGALENARQHTAVQQELAKRERADAVVHTDEEHYRLIFDAAPLGIARLDLQGRIVESNRSFQELLGYTEGELRDRSVADVTSAVDQQREAPRFQELVDGLSTSYDLEKVCYRKDNEPLWVHAQTTLIQDEQETPQFLLTILEDITYQKWQEEDLAASEALFRTMAESAPVMIWVVSPDAECTYVNQQWLTFSGRSLDEELRQGWRELVHPKDRVRWATVFHRAVAAQEAFRLEYRLRRADGQHRWVLNTGLPRYAADGTFIGFIGSCLDITERKATEAQLHLSAERFRLALRNSPTMVFQQDRQLRYSWVSGPVATKAGDEVYGQTDADFLPADAAGQLTAIKQAVLEREASRHEEVRSTIGGEEVVYDVYVEPLRNAAGDVVGITGTSTDITRRKQVEAALRLARSEAEILAEISRTFVASPGTLLGYDQLAQRVQQLIPFDGLLLLQVDREQQLLTPAYVAGVSATWEVGVSRPLTDSLFAPSVQQRRTQLVTDAASLAPVGPAELKGMVVVPLVGQETVIGLLVLESCQAALYAERDRILAERVGEQIAGGLAKVWGATD